MAGPGSAAPANPGPGDEPGCTAKCNEGLMLDLVDAGKIQTILAKGNDSMMALLPQILGFTTIVIY